MIQKVFGKNPGGERLERVKQSPNYKNGAFQNISPYPGNGRRQFILENTKSLFQQTGQYNTCCSAAVYQNQPAAIG